MLLRHADESRAAGVCESCYEPRIPQGIGLSRPAGLPACRWATPPPPPHPTPPTPTPSYARAHHHWATYCATAGFATGARVRAALGPCSKGQVLDDWLLSGTLLACTDPGSAPKEGVAPQRRRWSQSRSGSSIIIHHGAPAPARRCTTSEPALAQNDGAKPFWLRRPHARLLHFNSRVPVRQCAFRERKCRTVNHAAVCVHACMAESRERERTRERGEREGKNGCV